MATKIAGIYAEVRADSTKLDPDLKKIHKKIEASTERMIKAFKRVAIIGIAAATAGLYALNRAIKKSVAAANVQEAAEKRLESVLRATGGAAGYSADEMFKMAAQLQEITTFGDETTISAQAVLSTFKLIGQKVFPDVIKVSMDMATIMSTDLQTAIVMIGKAMNDPIRNLSAMSRAGVQFTKSQKELIKTLWESGDALGAQKIILKELESQFRGAATAATETFGGKLKQLNNVVGDLWEELGFLFTKNSDLVVILGKLIIEVKDWTKYISENSDAIKKWIKESIIESIDKIGKFATKIAALVKELKAYYKWTVDTRLAWYKFIGVIDESITSLEELEVALRTMPVVIRQSITDPLNKVKESVKSIDKATDATIRLRSALAQSETAVGGIGTAIHALGADWEFVMNNLATKTDKAGTNIDELARKYKDFGDIFPVNTEKAKGFFDGLIAGFNESEEEMRSFYDIGKTLFYDWQYAIETGMGDTFYDIFTGNFDDIEDVWRSTLNSMLAAFSDMLAAMLIEWAKLKFAKISLPWSSLGSASGSLFAAGFWAVFAIVGFKILGGLFKGFFGREGGPSPMDILRDYEAGLIDLSPEQLTRLKDQIASGYAAGIKKAWSLSTDTMGRDLQQLFQNAHLENYFKSYANDTADTLKERFADLDMTDAAMNLVEKYQQAMSSAGGLTGKYAIDLGINQASLNKIAESIDTSFGDKLVALGLVATATGWESTVTLDFITKFLNNESVRIEDKMDMLGFVITSTGWESQATLKFITQLAEQGVDWKTMYEAMKLFGASDEIIKKFRIQFLTGKVDIGWDALEKILLGTRLDTEAILKKVILEFEYLGKEDLSWDELAKLLKAEGITDPIIRLIRTKWMGDEKMDWDTLKALMTGGGVADDIMRQIFVKYKETADGLSWKELESLMIEKGVGDDIIRNIRLNFLTDLGTLNYDDIKDLLAGVGLSNDIILRIKTKFES